MADALSATKAENTKLRDKYNDIRKGIMMKTNNESR